MKMKYITIAIAVVVISFCMYGCGGDSVGPEVENHDVTIGDMSLTLPDGEWHYGNDENHFVGENCNIIAVKTSEPSYECDDKSFEFQNYDEILVSYSPEHDFMYLDGYVTEFDSRDNGISLMIEKDIYYHEEYYAVFFEYTGRTEAAKEETKEILRSISFDKSGIHPMIGMPCNDANQDIKEDIGDETTDVAVQGNVEEVTHATESEGKPYYIDLGAAYPDESRITGVIWEEYQDIVNESELMALKDREVILGGSCSLHNGSLQIRIEVNGQIVIIKEIDDL